MTQATFLPPDWVLTGAPLADGTVMVLASTKLRQADLEQVNHFDTVWDDFFSPRHVQGLRPDGSPDRDITLTVVMDDFILVQAPNYAAAFRHLFEQWEPTSSQRSALPGPQTALPH